MTQSGSVEISFGAIPKHIYWGVPVYLSWNVDGGFLVSITLPENLTLCASALQGHQPVSVIASDLGGLNYTWTPFGFVGPGSYSFKITLSSGDSAFSNDVLLSNEPIDTSSDSSHVQTPSTTSLSSTDFTGTTSSTQASATSLFNSISSAATGHSSFSASVTATMMPASARASSSQSPDVQSVSVLHHAISNGTIVGIVVGAVVFIILTTVSAMLCWRRRRRLSQTAVSELPDHQTHNDVKSNPAIWIPELDQEGAVYGPHELPDTPTPLASSLRSFEATQSQPAEGRVSEMADPGSTLVPTTQPLRSPEATESQPAEKRVSELADPGITPVQPPQSPGATELQPAEERVSLIADPE